MARLNRALTAFRAAVNAAYPGRDKSSDGWIGDPAHQARDSDHNPDPDGTVDAWDMDVDLRTGADPAAIEALKRVFQAHPAARYWIHNGRIAHRDTGWRRAPYTGSNRHDKHVHWNSHQATEDSTAPWILEDEMLTPDQAQKLADVHTATTRLPIDGERKPLHVVMAGLVGAVGEQGERMARIEQHLTSGAAGTVTDEQLERVLRRVIGSVDATPQA